MKYDFNEELATLIWVEEAIMFSNIAWWIKTNEANEKNFFDWKYWTYNSMSAYTKLFPFWSQRQIDRILANLKDHDLIITWNYNKSSYDRTLWYTISPNGEIYLTKWWNPNTETVLPIPDNKPYNKHISSSFKKEEARKEKLVDIENNKYLDKDLNTKDMWREVVDIEKENKNKEKSEKLNEDALKLFNYWNAQKEKDKHWIWVRKFDWVIKDTLIKILKQYSREDIELWLKNYKNDILNNRKTAKEEYKNHRFTLLKFFTQKNWFIEFYNKI